MWLSAPKDVFSSAVTFDLASVTDEAFLIDHSTCRMEAKTLPVPACASSCHMSPQHASQGNPCWNVDQTPEAALPSSVETSRSHTRFSILLILSPGVVAGLQQQPRLPVQCGMPARGQLTSNRSTCPSTLLDVFLSCIAHATFTIREGWLLTGVPASSCVFAATVASPAAKHVASSGHQVADKSAYLPLSVASNFSTHRACSQFRTSKATPALRSASPGSVATPHMQVVYSISKFRQPYAQAIDDSGSSHQENVPLPEACAPVDQTQESCSSSPLLDSINMVGTPAVRDLVEQMHVNEQGLKQSQGSNRAGASSDFVCYTWMPRISPASDQLSGLTYAKRVAIGDLLCGWACGVPACTASTLELPATYFG